MYEETLNEPIDVAVRYRSVADKNQKLFLRQRCQPIKFRRPNGQEVSVTELGLSYPIRDGRRLTYVFDVTDGQADYRLEFQTEKLSWYLTRVADND